MKLAVIGGAGMRVPLFLQGLVRFANEIQVDNVSLLDTNSEAMEIMRPVLDAVLEAAGRPFPIILTGDAERAFEGADFIISALRVGGMAGRVVDERVPLSFGVIGQETTGPGGFSMALRTIPVMLRYAELIEKVAPDAYFINFSNPSGIVTQSLLNLSKLRVIGICDTPNSLTRRLCEQLGVDPAEVFPDYLGLNHLGWMRGLYQEGRNILSRLLERPENYPTLLEVAIFGPEIISQLGMVPNEYLYYYYFQNEAVEHIKQSRQTRGEVLLEANRQLQEMLAQAARGLSTRSSYDIYSEYLLNRHLSYMSRETGVEGLRAKTTESNSAGHGYEEIAFAVIRAIALNRPQVIILNVANRNCLNGFARNDVVEVPCHVDGNGAHPLAMGDVPQECYGLMQQVKAYERLTIEAVKERSYAIALKALSIHPLVRSASLARRILDAYIEKHGPYLDYLKA